jgi:membrane fusion protein, multidrug efflux system
VSPFVFRVIAVRRLTLVGGVLASFFLLGCNRDAATPAKPAAMTAPAGAVATKAGGGAAAGTSDAAAAAKRAATTEKDKARQAAAEMVPVETALVTRGEISAFLPFNATLETEAVVDIYPQTSGQVEALLVEEGQVVKENDILLKIEDRELKVDVEESLANYDHLKRNFERIDDLYKRSLVNKQDYETQAYQLDQARLKLERARIRLSYAMVRAPFAGVVSARDTQIGARVGSATKLFSMVKLDDLVAKVFVPGRYLPVVAENQAAIVTSEFLPDRSFKGWVKRISPVIDPKSGTFKVTVGVRGDKPSDLPPGLFVGVRVITDTRADAVLIPKRAVVWEGGDRYVFTVVKDRAVKKKLTAGYEDPNNVQALSGFEVGTPVIVLGQSGLKDGSLVRSVNAATAPSAASIAKPGEEIVPAPKTSSTAEAAKPDKS